MSEFNNLQIIADKFGYSDGVMAASISHCYDVMRAYLVPGSILELGPAEGVMTTLLASVAADVTVVEGSSKFCKMIKAGNPKVNVVNSLFEDYVPERKYDNIILGHVLEHVDDPVALLVRAKSWLAPGGIVFAAVPNAKSIHRQAAVIMGMLETEAQLNQSDLDHGHRRVFAPEDFRKVFVDAGLETVKFGGYWLKPLSNKQIEDTWKPEMINAFMILGERYPDIAGEIYIVAR